MRTWIMGDSFITHAGKFQEQLRGGGTVSWKGLGGARIAGLGNKLHFHLRRFPYPTTLIIHLGCNDIFKSHLGDIRSRIKLDLKTIRNILPNTRIIWSDVLPG